VETGYQEEGHLVSLAMAENTDHDTTLITVTENSQEQTFLLANLAPPDHDPESIWSVVYEIQEGEFELNHEVEAWLTALRSSPNGRLLAASMDGELYTYDGRKWVTRDLECEDGLNDLWVIDDKLAVAVGERGERVMIRGARAEVVRDDRQRRLNAVRGSAAERIIAVGDEGLVWRYDGTNWLEQQTPTNHALLAVVADAGKDIFVGGADGVLFELGPESWREIDMPAEVSIYSLARFNGKLYAACGEDGLWVLSGSKLAKAEEYALDDLQSARKRMWGVGGTLLGRFDGKRWKTGDLDI
jgi:hypothetical protein